MGAIKHFHVASRTTRQIVGSRTVLPVITASENKALMRGNVVRFHGTQLAFVDSVEVNGADRKYTVLPPDSGTGTGQHYMPTALIEAIEYHLNSGEPAEIIG